MFSIDNHNISQIFTDIRKLCSFTDLQFCTSIVCFQGAYRQEWWRLVSPETSNYRTRGMDPNRPEDGPYDNSYRNAGPIWQRSRNRIR